MPLWRGRPFPPPISWRTARWSSSLYYIRNEHVLTWHFKRRHHRRRLHNKRVIYGSTITAPANVIRTGYDFMGWYNRRTVHDAAFSPPLPYPRRIWIFTPSGEARRDTVYTVEYYQQNVDDDGYTLVAGDTQSPAGNHRQKTESFADEDKYEFFTLNPSAGGYLASGTIAGDGSRWC